MKKRTKAYSGLGIIFAVRLGPRDFIRDVRDGPAPLTQSRLVRGSERVVLVCNPCSNTCLRTQDSAVVHVGK